MGRALRMQEPGETFHLTARGVRRQPLFHDEHDYRRYLALLDQTSRRFGWVVIGYCLMPNHVHLVVRLIDRCLSRAMHRQQGLFARRFNERHALTGHVFEARFHSTHITTDEQLEGVLGYVANNPVRAGLCESPEDWPWSGGTRERVVADGP